MASLPIVYSIRGCPACARLLEQWDAEGIAYDERRADLSQEAMDEARKLGDAVPIIVYPNGRIERRFRKRPPRTSAIAVRVAACSSVRVNVYQ